MGSSVLFDNPGWAVNRAKLGWVALAAVVAAGALVAGLFAVSRTDWEPPEALTTAAFIAVGVLVLAGIGLGVWSWRSAVGPLAAALGLVALLSAPMWLYALGVAFMGQEARLHPQPRAPAPAPPPAPPADPP